MLPPSLYAAVFKQSPIGCYLLSTTPEMTILDVNDSFLRTVSLTREGMIGKELFEVFSDNPDDAEDTGIEALRGSVARALTTGQPQVLPMQRFPIKKTLANGETIFEERFWSASNTPIYDEDGRMLCILHTTVEITKQVQAEAALKRSERHAVEAARHAEEERNRLDTVLEVVPVGIAVADANGAFQLVNAENRRIWGDGSPISRSTEEYGDWKGWWIDGLGAPGRPVETHEWPLARVLAGQDAPRSIIEIGRFDTASTRRTVLISAAAIRNAGGGIEGGVVAVMDITERIKAEEALKEANRRKDEFLAMLAHELRNPLAPISAAAELLEVGRLDEDRIKQTSAVISRQVSHMVGLVDDLLDVSRVTRGLVVLDKRKVDIKRVVADVVEQARPMIEAREHSLTVHTPPEPAFVLGDYKRLVQVFVNVLTNAAKYTPPRGRISLSMEVDGDHAKVTVTDNGVGMDAALLKRAFDMFSQAERTSDRSQGGLGIGLALVKSLVELHAGHIAAHSDGPGMGSRFTICLPHMKAGGETSGKERQPAKNPSASGRLKVMVVDDNADAAELLALLVESLGHEVIVEYKSTQALERAKAEMPDVCLLDIGLPDVDGNELARRLRAQPETAKTILVAVTGYGQEQDRLNAMSAGFDHHFVKPVSSHRIASLLSGIHRI